MRSNSSALIRTTRELYLLVAPLPPLTRVVPLPPLALRCKPPPSPPDAALPCVADLQAVCVRKEGRQLF